MIIVLKSGTGEAEIQEINERLTQEGFKVHLSQGVEKTIIGAVGDRSRLQALALEALPWVEKVVPILAPYKLVSREFQSHDTIIKVGEHEKIGRAHV